jgi:hypothetical protein
LFEASNLVTLRLLLLLLLLLLELLWALSTTKKATHSLPFIANCQN